MVRGAFAIAWGAILHFRATNAGVDGREGDVSLVHVVGTAAAVPYEIHLSANL